MEQAESKLLDLLVRRSYLYRPERPFVLASGKTSPIYIDCRSTTTFAEAMPLVGQVFFNRLKQAAGGVLIDAVGGLTLGADPIAAAVAYHSAVAGTPVSWFSVRKEPKQHGTAQWIEGSVEAGARVGVVDDVVTDRRVDGHSSRAMPGVRAHRCGRRRARGPRRKRRPSADRSSPGARRRCLHRDLHTPQTWTGPGRRRPRRNKSPALST